MLIGIVGFANSGKGTVGSVLVRDNGFVEDSFAAPLKDATASIFGWDRSMLEGDTPESRFWRERPDAFWTKELKDPSFTPRKAMQLLGTDGCRRVIGEDIWVSSLIKRWKDAGEPDTVVTDCRFPNEVDIIHELNGKIIRIKRGPDPDWYQTILFANKGFADEDEMKQIEQLRGLESIPHESETAWIGCQVDEIFHNDKAIVDLEELASEYAGGIRQLSMRF